MNPSNQKKSYNKKLNSNQQRRKRTIPVLDEENEVIKYVN